MPKNANPGLDVVKPLPIEEKEEEASALMRLDNEPNPNYFHQTHQLPINPNTKLSDANMLKAGIEFEMAMSKQGRLKQQCPDLQTIINSNFRLAAVRYTTAEGPFKEYIAAYNYQHSEDSGLNDAQNRKIKLNQSSINTIKYYHCIAQVVISNVDAQTSGLLWKARKRLRTLKRGMIALIIYRLAKGLGTIKPRTADEAKLLWFKESDPLFYHLYIVPLAATATIMMDAEDDPNLSLAGIVDVNLDSFTRNNRKLLRQKGMWSVDYLLSKASEDMPESAQKKMTAGMEFTVARIFCMLTHDTHFADADKWFLTPEETAVALAPSTNINPDVIYRV